MQEYRKLLCVNKIRETKRLIENMLIPILSLVVAAAVVGYQIDIKNSIFRNSLIFQGLPPIKYQNLMYFPLFLPL